MKEMQLLPCMVCLINSELHSALVTFTGENIEPGLWADGLAGQTARDQVYQNQIPTNHGYANWADLYTTINNANLF